MKKLRTNKLKPMKHVEDIRQSLLRKTHFTCEEMADAIEKITTEDIKVIHTVNGVFHITLPFLCDPKFVDKQIQCLHTF